MNLRDAVASELQERQLLHRTTKYRGFNEIMLVAFENTDALDVNFRCRCGLEVIHFHWRAQSINGLLKFAAIIAKLQQTFRALLYLSYAWSFFVITVAQYKKT